MSEVKKTAQTALIYTIGVVIHKLAGFIMLPIYTRYLSPADYGTIELLTMTIDVIGFFAEAGLCESIYRFYFKHEQPENRKTVIYTAFSLLTVFYFLAGTSGIFYSDMMASLVLEGSAEHTTAFRLMFIILLIGPTQMVPMILIRAQQKAKLFVLVAVGKLLLQIALNVYFVIVLKFGILGILTSTLISNSICGLGLTAYLLRFTGFRFSRQLAFKMLTFSSPLIISNIGNFIITYSDRYFLKAYWDLSAVGLYSLGYKMGFVFTALAVSPFLTTWTPKRFEIVDQEDFQKVNKTIFVQLSFFLSLVALCIAVGSRDLFRIMSAPEFVEAYKIVPLILLSYILQAWGAFINFGIYYKDKTKYLAITGTASSILMLLLCYTLIPPLGAYGAALATLITFAFRFILIATISQKLFRLSISWDKTLVILACAIFCYLFSRFTEQQNLAVSIGLNAFIVAFFVITVFFSPVFSVTERQTMLKYVRKVQNIIVRK